MSAQNGITRHPLVSIRRPRLLGVVLAIIVLAVAVAAPVVASATFQGEADWQDGKRTLKYLIDEAASDQWKAWFQEAIDNWNAKSADTGWTFEPAGEGEAPDVSMEADSPHSTNADGSAKQCGGAYAAGFGGDPLTGVGIHVDEDCTDQEFGDGAGGHTHPSGGDDGKGWGTDGATTLDPVMVVKHELSHAMRLDHSPDGGTDTGNLEDPIGLGNHDNPVDRVPSDSDVTEAHNASVGEVRDQHWSIFPVGGFVSFAGMGMMFPPGWSIEPTDVGIRVLPGTGIPDPTSVGRLGQVAGSGIFQAYEITPDGMPLGVPVTVTMQWDEESLIGGYFLGDTHGMHWAGGPESRLGVYWYNPTAGYWQPVEGAVVDTMDNVVSFPVTHFSLYGLGVRPPESEPVPASSGASLAALAILGLLGMAFTMRREGRAAE